RYPAEQWNIYAAQASDGDAFGADPEKSRNFLVEKLLPRTRYFAYIEVGDEGSSRASSLSAAYRRIESTRFALRSVQARGGSYPAFREPFGRQPTGRTAMATRTPISTGADWDFELLTRYDAASREIGVGEVGRDCYPNPIEVISSEQ